MKKTTVLYDDTCRFCRAAMRSLTRLDWLHALSPLAVSDPRALQAAPGLTHEALLSVIHCVAPDGRVYRGGRAFRHIMLRLPLLAPLGLLLWVPGLIGIAEAAYRWVAQNRERLSRLLGLGKKE